MSSFLQRYRHHRDLPSFPTRRSSDLTTPSPPCSPNTTTARRKPKISSRRSTTSINPCQFRATRRGSRTTSRHGRCRSEEHTSELQSHVNLVCRLLLEKKKNMNSCHSL